MEALVVVIERPSILWTSYGHMLAIQSPQGMMKLPSVTKLLSHPLPFLFSCGTDNDLIMVLIKDGLTDFSDQQRDGVVGHSEAIHQCLVAVTSSKEMKGDGQPQTRMKCLSIPGVLFGNSGTQSVDQFSEHGRFHSHKISEGSWIFSFQLRHQLFKLAIQRMSQ